MRLTTSCHITGEPCSHCRVPVFITGIFLYFPVLPCKGLQCARKNQKEAQNMKWQNPKRIRYKSSFSKDFAAASYKCPCESPPQYIDSDSKSSYVRFNFRTFDGAYLATSADSSTSTFDPGNRLTL